MSCVVERTVIATGLAVRAVFNIHKEFTSCGEHFLTPIKSQGSTLTRLIGRLFIEWFMGFIYERSILYTLSKILGKVKVPGGKFCLWRILREMGFAYIKRDSKWFIYEQEHVIGQRHTYPKRVQKLNDERL